ncbi:Cthe_2314 family HEPN domain-containing protein [Paenibacillus sp. MER TA 81-3]|uniref:Cthe_2314 family HEPN domain-containing protein n=1 Tax=Paenibacillus sp. MER TA 81-3 TaxID=2939573 RepID=UPI00203D4EA4|nr:Cthe_2314 family HEPN domain-containing protein [Paenibacillus sp. MER TA 81-3]MCM3338928.1 Cthe_2314 family HEPN domain-containing protein [Paenibacillus sp. MER TA 81-3]
MLRILFGEPPRQDEGELQEAMVLMERYLNVVRKQMDKQGDPEHYWRKIEVWTVGLKTSLDELEQSVYASDKFAERVTKRYQAEMDDEELDDYYRHVYFYKNGFIRVFSILDKLGTLLNTVLQLETEKVKHRFSYFTVLRQIRFKGSHPRLAERLTALKDQYGDALQRLRKRRNTEIHHMNAEMQDDLWQRHRSLSDKIKLEDIQANLQDLQDGFHMACKTLLIAFEELCKLEK